MARIMEISMLYHRVKKLANLMRFMHLTWQYSAALVTAYYSQVKENASLYRIMS